MLKKFRALALIMIALLVGQVVFDAHYKPTFYNRFREIPAIETSYEAKKLTLSGSSSYVIGHLSPKFSQQHNPIYVIDLQEKATDFIKNYPQHWLGYDKNLPEKNWLNRYKYYGRRLILTGKFRHTPLDFTPANDVVSAQKLLYIPLLQTRKKVPDQAFVDQLITFLKSLPEDAHLHVYCREGKGRTSIILLMIDIWRSQGQIPLDQLVKAHHQAGSEDLLDTTIWENGTYTPEMLQRRKAFIQQFFDDVRRGQYPI